MHMCFQYAQQQRMRTVCGHTTRSWIECTHYISGGRPACYAASVHVCCHLAVTIKCEAINKKGQRHTLQTTQCVNGRASYQQAWTCCYHRHMEEWESFQDTYVDVCVASVIVQSPSFDVIWCLLPIAIIVCLLFVCRIGQAYFCNIYCCM